MGQVVTSRDEGGGGGGGDNIDDQELHRATLGRIVTRALGMPYRQCISETILRPLGMTSTTLEPRTVPAGRLAQGYRWEDDQWRVEPQLPDGAFGSMRGMLISMRDLGVYVGMFLDAWPPRDGAETGAVKRASLREMQQIHQPRPPAVVRGTGGTLQLYNTSRSLALRMRRWRRAESAPPGKE